MYAHLNTALMVIDIILFAFFVLSIIAAGASYCWLKKLGLKLTQYLAISVRRSVETSLGLGSWKNRLIASANVAATVLVFYYALPLSMVSIIVSYGMIVIGWLALHKHPAYRLASL